jgi:hypothetical protein
MVHTQYHSMRATSFYEESSSRSFLKPTLFDITQVKQAPPAKHKTFTVLKKGEKQRHHYRNSTKLQSIDTARVEVRISKQPSGSSFDDC